MAGKLNFFWRCPFLHLMHLRLGKMSALWSWGLVAPATSDTAVRPPPRKPSIKQLRRALWKFFIRRVSESFITIFWTAVFSSIVSFTLIYTLSYL